MTSTAIALSGYLITALLHESSRTLVYRGQRETDRQPVVIKLPRNEYPSFNELLQFRNQYTIALNLNHTGIVRPYSLERYRNSYALVMEDFGGISLQEWLSATSETPFRPRQCPIPTFLNIAIQLAEILDKLHRDRVIHKDIKPANVLIHPETQNVQLIDFSIASLLPKETQDIQNPNVLEGTLTYISPEQTGRMNRGIDYRSDFYSLGVTFYELLAGQLPFASSDAMDLVHCHIAKSPPPLRDFQISPGLETIVMKLMAKNAEDRYQTALGLKYDLEKCLMQWQATGQIESFTLGERDLCDRFTIPEKLYGRETEVAQLLAAFERVSGEDSENIFNSELLLVAGFSGIGKTAVVNEVHKPIVQRRGYFIKGKFDQFNRNVPFSAFVQAFRDLMRQLLSESDFTIEQWKAKVLSALGENGQVIIDVIPELERIIGKQPPVPELSGSAATNRFNLLFQNFIRVFSAQEHPLVIFLDDLQWSDSASLKLMHLLMSNPESRHLLTIGAYRDNEVRPTDSLSLTLEAIRKAGAKVNTITLSPLERSHIDKLVADALNCSLELAQPLAELVYRKTRGNPFFSTQFLKSLYEEGLIRFSPPHPPAIASGWECELTQIKALTLTDDVVEFMALQLQKLPQTTQDILKLAACIGNQFDLNTLAIVSERSPEETASNLWKALQEEFVLPTSEVYKFYQTQDSSLESDFFARTNSQSPHYKFLHDRVQQAAYSLIPEARKQSTHLKIGQLLLQNIPPEQQEESIFEIVNQLNVGKELIDDRAQRDTLAQLNLVAGQKSKASTAYTAAFDYFNLGIALLEEKSWDTLYDLSLNLYNSASETAYLNGHFEAMEALASIVLKNTKSLLDKVKIYEVKIQGYAAQNDLQKAINTALEILRLLDIHFPEAIDNNYIQNTLGETLSFWHDKKPSDLINLPQMEAGEYLASMQILSAILPFAYQINPELFLAIVLQQVELSLKHGNTQFSSDAYACYGFILCSMVGKIEAGFQFGELSLNLLEKFANTGQVKPIYIVNAIVKHWKIAISQTLEPLLEAYTMALENGDLPLVAWSAYMYGYHAYFTGKELTELEREMANYSQQLSRINQETLVQMNELCRQAILNLTGGAGNPVLLRGSAYDEMQMLPLHHQTNNRTLICKYHLQKLILCYLFEYSIDAVKNAKLTEQYLDGVLGYIDTPLFHFYDSLAHLSIFEEATHDRQNQILERVGANQAKMETWGHHAPMNYWHKFELVEAERYRALGKRSEALEYYDRAIKGAKTNGYLQEEAVANELAAKFYLTWEKEKIARDYAIEAYYCYARWGAKAKTDALEKRYPQLLNPILQPEKTRYSSDNTINPISTGTIHSSSTTGGSAMLDLAAVLKASQTLSSEIELDKLLSTLMRIAIANAGADRGALVLQQDRRWKVAIRYNSTEGCTLESTPLNAHSEVPVNVINLVKRTAETLVFDDVMTQSSLAVDPYLMRHRPKSLLCSPILNQGKPIGIIYLENHLATGAFTRDRVEVLNLLCSQAAISIENARLYQQAQDYAQQLEQTLENLQHMQLQLVQSEKMSALGNLVAGVAHEINNPVGFIAGNLQPARDYIRDLLRLLDLYQEQFPEPGDPIEEEIETIDLAFLREDLLKLIGSLKEGTDRIYNISNSLRTFSRADTDYRVPFDVHEGLDSTLLILKHRLKEQDDRPAIEVVKKYGYLPLVECFPGQLNQVFMNLLANAIDALEEASEGRSYEEIRANPNRIIIRTELESDRALIRIRDNGLGIPETVKNRIFDQGYTTKGVGKGTGLGLAIAKSIVEEVHGGILTCTSEVNQGTEFAIALDSGQ
jgi:predicted ATPase/signal transduction histidine kinase/tRNA A-37 threonylcarbamoyl transferase component Bud32